MAPLSRKIALTEAELDELLGSSTIMRIASHGPGARINLTPMWFTWQDGAIYTWCRGQKLANMRRDPSVTVLVDRGEQFNELQGVMIHGTATVLEDGDAEDADAGLSAVRAGSDKYAGRRTGARGDPRTRSAASSATRRWVRIDPVAVVTWDNTKLAQVRAAREPQG